MYTMNEDLARAHMSSRLGEARQMRAGREMARARRLSRKAERAAPTGSPRPRPRSVRPGITSRAP